MEEKPKWKKKDERKGRGKRSITWDWRKSANWQIEKRKRAVGGEYLKRHRGYGGKATGEREKVPFFCMVLTRSRSWAVRWQWQRRARERREAGGGRSACHSILILSKRASYLPCLANFSQSACFIAQDSESGANFSIYRGRS